MTFEHASEALDSRLCDFVNPAALGVMLEEYRNGALPTYEQFTAGLRDLHGGSQQTYVEAFIVAWDTKGTGDLFYVIMKNHARRLKEELG